MSFKALIYDCIKNNMPQIQREREEVLSCWKNWRNNPDNAIVMFGASAMCEICIRHMEKLGINVDIICDNDTGRWGEFVTDSGRSIKIVSVEQAMDNAKKKLCFIAAGAKHFPTISSQLEKYRGIKIVAKWHLDLYLELMRMVCTQSPIFLDKIEELLNFYEDEESLKIVWAHFSMLLEMENVPEELKLVTMEDLCNLPQYYLENGKYLKKQKIMIDCGAYVGDTLEDLVLRNNYKDFESYECFEMLPSNFQELKKAVEKLPNELRTKIHIYNLGVGQNNASIKATDNNNNSCIIQNGGTEVKIIRLDDVYADKNVTFLKMDIEGSEQAALRGSKNMISKCQPMCAICIYHSLAAFWDIPQILKEYVPEYVMILRHHSSYWEETVCYAKIGEWD